jgi:hypothetical protein
MRFSNYNEARVDWVKTYMIKPSLIMHSVVCQSRLPTTTEMVKVNGVWEECLIQPIKENPADEAYQQMMDFYRKQVIEAFAISRFADMRYQKAYENSLNLVDKFIKQKGKL